MFERHGHVDIPDHLREEIAEEARVFARETRAKLGIDFTDAIHLIPLLEQQGILVFQMVGLGISGFVRIFGDDKAIFLDASEPLGRQHYTAAHEYAHILFHLHRVVDLEGLAEADRQLELKKMEHFANAFADHFLITPESLKAYFATNGLTAGDTLTISDVIRIQHHFQVSYRQTTRMLKKASFLTEDQQNELNQVSSKDDPQRLVRETEKMGYPVDLVTPLASSRLPVKFLNAMRYNIEAGRLTERKVRHLQEVLGVPDLLRHLKEVGHGE